MEAKDRYGWTALHYAAVCGHLELVRLLCDRGADIEVRYDSEYRPLHVAAYHGHISIVKELIEVRNAEINARNNSGETALWLARHTSRDDIAAYLVSHGGVDDIPIDE